MNVLSNARQAVNSKFGVDKQVKNISISAEEFADGSGNFVQLRIRNNGVGFNNSVRERICDPFFTTKPRGEGTGLGLSISHGLVKEHDGHLLFESFEGQYTEITLRLPRYWAAPRPRPTGGSGSIYHQIPA